MTHAAVEQVEAHREQTKAIPRVTCISAYKMLYYSGVQRQGVRIFAAPIFLAAEIFFALGYNPGLRGAMQRRAMRMRAQAGVQNAGGSLKSA